MTLILDINLKAKTYGFGSARGMVQINDVNMSMEEFVRIAWYVLTNTDMDPEDPRKEFVRIVKESEVVEGWNGPGSVRIAQKG